MLYIKCLFLLLFSVGFSQSHTYVDLTTLSKLSLERNPNSINAKYSIDLSESELQIQKSIFDHNIYTEISYNRSQYRLFNEDPRNEFIDKYLNSNQGNINIGLQKLFKSGLSTDLSLGYDLISDNYPYNQFNQDVGPFQPNHSSSIALRLTQPLLRGWGTAITTAPVRIQELYIKNRKSTTQFINSYEILQVAYAYWNYLKYYKNLEIYIENENRVRQVAEMTSELIKADKKAASELIQANADLSRQERLTEVAKQNLYNSRIELGLIIGLTSNESVMIGAPSNQFPTPFEFNISTLNLDSIAQQSYESRGDLTAMKYNYEISKIEMEVAKNNLKPELNASLLLNYGGQNAGSGLSSSLQSFTNDEGRNIGIGIGLRYSIPIENNFGKGSYSRSKTNMENVKFNENTLIREIKLRINTAINNLQKSISILEKAREALEFNKSAYNNEKEKFQNGLTTLLSLILFQERLTYAELDYIQAQQQFANAIVGFRHETGTLILRTENSNFTIIDNAFYAIPISFTK